jgi:hypothetical protein
VNTTDNIWTFGYSVDNTSSTASRVSVWGFDTNPNFTSVTLTGAFAVSAAGNIPGAGTLEFCAKAGGQANNCNNGDDGVFPNDAPATGTLVLDFLEDANPTIELTNFFVRYQSVGANGQGSATGTTLPRGEPFGVNPVPIPGMAAALPLIVGLGGYMGWRKRRKQAAD